MKAATYQIDEEGILDSTFNYLVKHGLENITIRELCKGTGIAQGSIYYWFSGKQDLICEAAEYGLRKVVDKIFSDKYLTDLVILCKIYSRIFIKRHSKSDQC